MRARRAWRWWTTAAAVTGLLTASGAVAAAAPTETATGTATPHQWVRGYAVTDAGIWGNRVGETWWCSWIGFACGKPPARPFTRDDVPVATLDEGEQVTIQCWKGSYYLIDYGTDGKLGWAVADRDVRPLPSTSGTTDAQQCSLLDEAS